MDLDRIVPGRSTRAERPPPAPWAVSRWASPTASKPGGQKTMPHESVPVQATVRRLTSNSAPLQNSHGWCLCGIDVDETTPSPDKGGPRVDAVRVRVQWEAWAAA